jgi:uncharacterized membrane protein YGL010W
MSIDFWAGFTIGVIVFYIGMRIVFGLAMRRLNLKLTEFKNSLDNHAESFIDARVEEHNGVFYIYNVIDESFIAHGTTVKEIRDAIDAKFKGVSINISEGQQDVVARFKETQ